MKKIATLLITLCVALMLVACGGTSVQNARATIKTSVGGTRKLTFTIEIKDPNSEVTAPIKVSLKNSAENEFVSDDKFSTKEFVFTGLEASKDYTLIVTATKNGKDVQLLKETKTTFAVGESEDDPIEISTKDEFLKMAENGKKYYKLTQDIDFGGESIAPLFTSTSSSSDKAFTGYFDGNGKTISNIHIKNEDHVNKTDLAIFGVVHSGTIKNVKFDNIIIDNSAKERASTLTVYLGVVASRTYSDKAVLENIDILNSKIIYNQGAREFSIHAGLLVGELQGSVSDITLTNSSIELTSNNVVDVDNNLSKGIFLGGVIGTVKEDKGVKIENIISDVDVSLNYEEKVKIAEASLISVGGIIGSHYGMTSFRGITKNLIAKGTINISYDIFESSEKLPVLRVGGIAGSSSVKLSNVYAANEITIDANRFEANNDIVSYIHVFAIVAVSNAYTEKALADQKITINYENVEVSINPNQIGLHKYSGNGWNSMYQQIAFGNKFEFTINEDAKVFGNYTEVTDFNEFFTEDWIKVNISK